MSATSIVIPPKVFISYSHDSPDHMGRVLALADRLRSDGIDASCDQYVPAPQQGWPTWMRDQIEGADFVLVISTETYARRFNGREEVGRGLGATWEGAIVTQALYAASAQNIKFIPVGFSETDVNTIPGVLQGATHYDLTTPDGYEMLFRRLTQQHLIPVPPLGSMKVMPPRDRKQLFEPITPAEPHVHASQVAPPTRTPPPAVVWDEPWFASHRGRAQDGLARIGKTGLKEVQFTLSGAKLNRGQGDLLAACEKAAVHTFGWPIGIVMNRSEYHPKPRTDGIVAEIATDDKDHYQYWAMRNNGDFYLLKSLFEDARRPNAIFFNSRIARATEVFLYCDGLYNALGVPTDTVVNVRVRYGGLNSRTLAAVGNRVMWDGRTAEENEVQVVVSAPLGEIRARIVELVKEICSPLFILFDFFQLDDAIYRQIVTDYVNGKVS